jgi:two-component system, OmpR family, sensor histidine kinase BaeS
VAGRSPEGPPRAAAPQRGDLPGQPGRVSLVSPQGLYLSGRQLAAEDPVLQRDVVVNGQTVARVRLLQGPAVTQAVDAAFLARQYRGILVTALCLLLLAAAGAVWVGRRWLQPVRAAQRAAQRIAKGAFDVRLQPTGQDELADLARDINAMAASLQDLESSRRRWIAELSHEMRTPLAVLQGELEALIDGLRPLGPTALASLQEEVARVSRLVEDFHQLALSDLRALPCHFVSLQPQRLLQEAAARVAPRMQAAGLQLGLEGASESAPQAASRPLPLVTWDAQRIGQLLANLLENSLRYTDAPGRVQLSLATGGSVAAPQLHITVQDSAPCVPEAELPRLFEPLYRADPSRSRRSGGSGLGLAICRAIVASHGGHIEARRSALGGLCVVVTLPLHAGTPVGLAA